MTFIRVPYKITTTKWEGAKNFIHPIMSQLSVPPGIWGWRYAAVFIFFYLIRDLYVLSPWSNSAVSTFAPLKTMKGSNFVLFVLLLGKRKHEFFRLQLFLQLHFFLWVSSTVVAEAISAQTGVSSVAIISAASYGCFMTRRRTCKTKDTNLSMSWSGFFWATYGFRRNGNQ